MSLYSFKPRQFKKRKVEESDEEDEDYLEVMEKTAYEEEERKGKKKKKKDGTKKSKASKAYANLSDEEEEVEVEALEPVRRIDTEPETVEVLDVEVPVDDATRRRRKLIEEAQEAREALMRATREGEAVANLIEIDDEENGADENRCAEDTQSAPKGRKMKVVLQCGKEKDPWTIRYEEPLVKLFARFADERGVCLSRCKFSFDGDVLKDTDTPQALEMDDDDMLDVTAPPRTKPKSDNHFSSLDDDDDDDDDDDVRADRVVGSPAAPAPPPAPPQPTVDQETTKKKKKGSRAKVLLLVKGPDDVKPKKFMIHDDDPFRKALQHYAKKKSVALALCTFTAGGRALDLDATPADSHLQDQISIDASR